VEKKRKGIGGIQERGGKKTLKKLQISRSNNIGAQQGLGAGVGGDIGHLAGAVDEGKETNKQLESYTGVLKYRVVG